ncbi:MAG: SAM-dependent methyltransferase [Bacteroidales bacterium]|nr:SAM-dependent methyltransferase [Bacteroidales bacterium]
MKGLAPYIELLPFVSEHLSDEVTNLLLTSSKHTQINVSLAVTMIKARNKIDNKVPSWKNMKQLCFPDSLSAEQSSSEITAKYKQRFVTSKSVSDLTCGLGVDSIFMAEVASEVVSYEKNPLLCSALEYNSTLLGISNLRVINREIDPEWAETLPEGEFDLIYIDPSRRDSRGKRVACIRDYSPDILTLKNSLLKAGKSLLVKISSMTDISATLAILPETTEVHILSVRNECRELLFLMKPLPDFPENLPEPEIHMVNYENKQWQIFSGTIKSERESRLTLAEKGPATFLYEPNSSIMKGGAFRSVSGMFGLRKLAVNTHLYTSDVLIREFPGRIFRVIKVHSAGKKGIKEIRENIGHANISVRNFPSTAQELKKQTGIRDGGEIFLTGCTLFSGKKCIVESIRVN